MELLNEKRNALGHKVMTIREMLLGAGFKNPDNLKELSENRNWYILDGKIIDLFYHHHAQTTAVVVLGDNILTMAEESIKEKGYFGDIRFSTKDLMIILKYAEDKNKYPNVCSFVENAISTVNTDHLWKTRL